MAFSNEAFELWFLLHFEYYNTPIPRKDYQKMLTNKLGRKYEKNDKTIYNDLSSKQLNGIKNARKLYNQKLKEGLPFSKCNPVTTVFLLVEELNKWI